MVAVAVVTSAPVPKQGGTGAAAAGSGHPGTKKREGQVGAGGGVEWGRQLLEGRVADLPGQGRRKQEERVPHPRARLPRLRPIRGSWRVTQAPEEQL